MKKFLLSLFIGALYHGEAQTVIWMEDFNDRDLTGWTLIDKDGDGHNWGDTFEISDHDGVSVTPISLISRSWIGTPLYPNNWAITPAIDLSSVEGPITLQYITQVAANGYDREKYSIYVSTSTEETDFLNAPVQITEILGNEEHTGIPEEKSLDLSVFAGEPAIYIAVRHWGVTNNDFISIDDMQVIEGSLATTEIAAETRNQIAMYPNPAKDVVKVNLGEAFDASKAKVTITSVAGKIVSNIAYNANGLDVSSLAAGVYILTVTDGKNTQSKKLIKK